MSFLASLALLAVVLPQDPPSGQGGGQAGAPAAQERGLLTPAERNSLRDKFVKYLDADESYVKATGLKDREKAGRALERAKEAFDGDWEKFSKKGNLLGSMVDLRAIMDNCFLLKEPSFSKGQLRKETIKERDETAEFSFFLPKTYKADKPCRTVVVVPGNDAAGAPVKPADYYASIWDKAASQNDTIFVVAHTSDKLEMDPVPDYSRDGAAEEEDRRNRVIFTGWGQVMANYNVDRNRVFLDCGRGNSAFGVRFLTLFPDRFAGLILRHPTEVEDIRLGSLLGLPVLLLKSKATADAVEALKKQLEAVSPGSVTVLETTDEYPFKASAPAIEAWMAERHRTMTPMRIVIEPNHDRFKRAFWASIDVATPLLAAAPDARPRLEVVANRDTNRIVVKAQAVESFELYLNDDLVDLSKDFTVVINDKAIVEKKTRSFRDLYDRMVVRRDWEYLFPVAFRCTVPKPAAENGDKKQ